MLSEPWCKDYQTRRGAVVEISQIGDWIYSGRLENWSRSYTWMLVMYSVLKMCENYNFFIIFYFWQFLCVFDGICQKISPRDQCDASPFTGWTSYNNYSEDKVWQGKAVMPDNYNVSLCCLCGTEATKYHLTQLFDKKTGNCISLNSNDISDIITENTSVFWSPTKYKN